MIARSWQSRCWAAFALLASQLGCTSFHDCTGSSGERSSSSANAAVIAKEADPGCRENVEFAPTRQASRSTNISLSLAKFGPSPAGASGLAAWAAAEPVASTCRQVGTSEPKPPGFDRGGGFIQTFCTFEIGSRKITSPVELAAALAPIDSPRKALALVAISHPIAFDADLRNGSAEKSVRLPVSLDSANLAVFDVASFDGGFVVRVPLELSCPLSVHRVAFRVTTVGELCFAKEPALLIDAGTGVCVD